MLTLAYPWLAVLLPLPWLVAKLWRPHAETRSALRVPFLDRLAALTGTQPRAGAVVARRSLLRMGVLIFCWLLALLALMRPQWIEPPLHQNKPTRDLLLLVDLSGSMSTKDFTSADGQPIDRLTAVKQVLGDFLAKREGDRIGIVVFGDAAFTLVPFTTDLTLCRQLLQEMQVGMAGPRTVFGDAIGLGITQFKDSTVKQKTIVALTDGNDTASKVPPVEAARIARDQGIVIHTVAIGDPQAVGEDKLDEQALRDVAQDTGGGFYRAMDRGQLADIYKRLDAIETRKIDTVTYRPKTDLYWLPLLGLLALSLGFQSLSLLFGRTRTMRRETAALPRGAAQ